MASYRTRISKRAQAEARRLPGYVRQRIARVFLDLKRDARPLDSEALDVGKIETRLRPGTELRRIRLESWRVVYLLDEQNRLVTVLTVRKRPPYRYEDLDELLRGLLEG